jgi:transposase-like protein
VLTKTGYGHKAHGATTQGWPEAMKRGIVTASVVPGASVSVVARQYDVNANQVFTWRSMSSFAS